MKILIADDDPVTLDSLGACLEQEGYDVVAATDGDEALALWQEHKPDLCCLDIMMPHMNGYDVCRRIREKDPLLPILFLSAKSEEIDVVVGLQVGADDFVRKPFGKHELLARIMAALRRAQQSQPTRCKSFEMGKLTVYPLELRAEVGGRSVDLSPRETAILEVLHERAGEAVSRDDLLDRCWGVDYYPESRTLDQHISKLRRRINDDPDSPEIIETVRGIGYRFRGDRTRSDV